MKAPPRLSQGLQRPIDPVLLHHGFSPPPLVKDNHAMRLQHPILDGIFHVEARWGRLAGCQLLQGPQQVILHVIINDEGLPALRLLAVLHGERPRLVVGPSHLVVLLPIIPPTASVAFKRWGRGAHILHAGLGWPHAMPAVGWHASSLSSGRSVVSSAVCGSGGRRLELPVYKIRSIGVAVRRSLHTACLRGRPAVHGPLVAEELAPVRQPLVVEVTVLLHNARCLSGRC
mmetsp:Transcript_110869/g.345549  ORF Transcript_110869/g.345549 Transcript_110869/m.345549 type:complete len:230 (-) Transcript_110869:254-943(-)